MNNTLIGSEIRLRPFSPTDADYEHASCIQSTVWPEDPVTVEEMKFGDATRGAKYKTARYFAERNGKAVGFGEYTQWASEYHPQKFNLSVNVLPEYQNQGIGTALYEYVTNELTSYDPIALHAAAREDREIGIKFLLDRGFIEVMREQASRLDLKTFDPTRFACEVDRATLNGITVKSLRELRESDPLCHRKLYEAFCSVAGDVPQSEPHTFPDYDDWERRIRTGPRVLPDAYSIAVDEETGLYVGLSILFKPQTPGTDLQTGLTGVRREFRKRGIATALKLRALTWAKASNLASGVVTENEVNNTGMLGINYRLGFIPEPMWLMMTKTIREEG